MSTRAAINGLGRIGRAILKLLIDEPGLELVAVNDLVDAANLAYLLRFDTVYGRYSKPVVVMDGQLNVGGRKLQTLRERDPAKLPWRASIVDLELTKVVDGDRLKIMSWYDNEWGYANQMVRQAVSMTAAR